MSNSVYSKFPLSRKLSELHCRTIIFCCCKYTLVTIVRLSRKNNSSVILVPNGRNVMEFYNIWSLREKMLLEYLCHQTLSIIKTWRVAVMCSQRLSPHHDPRCLVLYGCWKSTFTNNWLQFTKHHLIGTHAILPSQMSRAYVTLTNFGYPV